MSSDRVEYERAKERRKRGLRAVKLPGEVRHAERSESAETIARSIAIAKREARLKAATRD